MKRLRISPSELISWPLLSVILSVFILFFGMVGIVARMDRELLFRLFDLDFEHNFPTLFSALLLFGNAWMVLHLKRRGMLTSWGAGLSLVFFFMACDELFRIHERSERLLHIDFQIAFLPLILIAAVGWFSVLFRIKSNFSTVLLWIGGAAAWGTSQLLEAAAWGWWIGENVQAEGYVIMMILEELLEMSGSALFFITLLKFNQSVAEESAPDNPGVIPGRANS